MNSRPRQAVKSFRPVRAAFFRMPVKSGRAGTGYEATLSLLKYIEVEIEMVKKFITFVLVLCVSFCKDFCKCKMYFAKMQDFRYIFEC